MFLLVLQMFCATPTSFVNAVVILQVVVLWTLWTTLECTAIMNCCNSILGIRMSCCNSCKLELDVGEELATGASCRRGTRTGAKAFGVQIPSAPTG